jgi:titin
MNENYFPAAPSRPERITATITDKDSVTLEWGKPKSDGGSRLRRYVIWRRVEMTEKWVKVTTVEHYTTKTVVDKLEFEKNYLFAVSAENDIGESDKTQTMEPVRLTKPSGRVTIQS